MTASSPGATPLATRHEQLLNRFGLETMKVPAATADIVDKRIRGLWEVNFEGRSIESLPECIKRYGFDCYTQGLLDATSPKVRAGIQRLVLEGHVPPMEPPQ